MNEARVYNCEEKDVFLTKYALTNGIVKVTVKKSSSVSEDTWFHPKSFSHYKMGRDIFDTFEEAENNAESRRLSKIASLQKQIEKLEKKKFKETK